MRDHDDIALSAFGYNQHVRTCFFYQFKTEKKKRGQRSLYTSKRHPRFKFEVCDSQVGRQDYIRTISFQGLDVDINRSTEFPFFEELVGLFESQVAAEIFENDTTNLVFHFGRFFNSFLNNFFSSLRTLNECSYVGVVGCITIFDRAGHRLDDGGGRFGKN